MRLKLAYLLIILGFGLFAAGQSLPSARAQGAYVAVVRIDGIIDDVSARYLSRSIDRAAKGGAELVVVQLNTPGGALSSTRDIVGALLSAEVPVAVYVSPPGAQAASAGTFITAAANFAAMAPGTNIGAASPVATGGRGLPSTVDKKINQDTQAFIRSIAQARGRNGDALEKTVTEARSYSAGEAVESKVVDFIAGDLVDLLARLDGQTVQIGANAVALQTSGADIRDLKPTLLESFLGVLSNPDLAFALLVAGGLLVLIEFLTPGIIGFGVTGVLCLVLAFMGLWQLPVNWVGVGLVLAAMVLFFLELQHSGFGVLGIGGIVCLLLGGFLLFGGWFGPSDIPEPSRVSWWAIGTLGAGAVAFLALFMYLLRPTGSATGYVYGAEDALIGQPGLAISDLAPVGRVRVADQEWAATGDLTAPILQGTEVRVLGVYGTTLRVSRALPEGTAGKLFKRHQEREVQKAIEARQQEPVETAQAEMEELRAALRRGFSSVNSRQGLKALDQLAYAYARLQPVLAVKKEPDLTATTEVRVLVQETYRQGLSALANALQLMQVIHSSDGDVLEAAIADLEREIQSLRQGRAGEEQLRVREETLASHRERLDLLRQQQQRVDALLHQAARCEDSLYRARMELAALQADSAETNVTMVTESLRRTIDRAKDIQEELKTLGF